MSYVGFQKDHGEATEAVQTCNEERRTYNEDGAEDAYFMKRETG